jgi:DNA invertase Pin-like site-specific DNA recombinase
MRTAIYARVSTADQTNAIQIRELKEYVERRGWELASVYQDQMSGAKASRPGLDQLIADARRRKFDVVVVWKLDRFGRSYTASPAFRNWRASGFASLPPRRASTRTSPTRPASS